MTMDFSVQETSEPIVIGRKTEEKRIRTVIEHNSVSLVDYTPFENAKKL